ncbi:MAG: Gfo/Idh/MocA family oxidoreductase [Anaerohalosphaeraceae bacterium]
MKKINRRTLIKGSVAAAAGFAGLPFIFKSVARASSPSPSNRITVGCIGIGWQGGGNLDSFLNEHDAQVVAVCDVDANHLRDAKRKVDSIYGNQDCKAYSDFRELLGRPDIDAVCLSLPDHWHGLIGVAAAKAGKDIFGEKPLTHNLREGRLLCDAVKYYGRIWQTGSWQRSVSHFRQACELVRNGRIGKIHTVEVGLPAGHADFGGTRGQETACPSPPELDYDFWLGPAPLSPYCPARVHKNWRWVLDYGGGQLMDWVGHHVDIAHWGLDMDHTGPVEIEGKGEYPYEGLWNTATRYRLNAVYENGIQMIIAGGYDEIQDGTKWIGSDGWVHVNRQRMVTSSETIKNEPLGAGDIHLLNSPGHTRNFLDCVKSRRQTLTPCETAHRSATVGHLGQIAMLLERKIKFNPATEQILDDPVAEKMLGRTMRSPWLL